MRFPQREWFGRVLFRAGFLTLRDGSVPLRGGFFLLPDGFVIVGVQIGIFCATVFRVAWLAGALEPIAALYLAGLAEGGQGFEDFLDAGTTGGWPTLFF